MTAEAYTVVLTRSAARALAEKLPLDVAAGAVELFAGPLTTSPKAVQLVGSAAGQ